MTVKTIAVKEHTVVEEEDLISIDLKALEGYLRRSGLPGALDITPSGIKTKHWVGVIAYRGVRFQILPKLISDDSANDERIIRNLIFMLSYTKKLKIRTTEEADFGQTKNPFLEVLIREYARSLFDCLKRITPRNYVRVEDNLRFLKGKLRISENIKYNSADKSRFYCEFDEFSEDNELNRLFLFVSSCLYEVSNDTKNKTLLKFITNYFSEIKLIKFDLFKANKIRLSRSQEMFRKPFDLAKMFIEHASIDLSQNKFRNITLIWDMNKLFEEFVFEVMKRYEPELSGWKVKAQKQLPLFVELERDKKSVKVDILAEREEEKIVIDTKYKQFAEIGNIESSDICQVSTYCLMYGASKAVLLYPLWERENPDTGDILNVHQRFSKNLKIQIDFRTIDLKQRKLGTRHSLEEIKAKLVKILNGEL